MAGEVRRFCEIVAEAVVVCAAPARAALLPALAALLHDAAADASGGVAGRHSSGVPVRVVTAPVASFGATLVWHTGSARHLEQLAARAATGGLTFAAGDLTDASRRTVECGEEADLYERLGLPWIQPSCARATARSRPPPPAPCPELLGEKDILGAVHVHTTDSDGAASLDGMADAAAALGWSLLGIADHSQAAAYAHGLDAARLRAQGEAIAARNARGVHAAGPARDRGRHLGRRRPRPAGGRPLDFVVASVHSSFRQSREAQTARLVRAVGRGPGTILGHPTGRLLLAREGYQVDLEAVLQAAAASGAAVEINAHPFRLDLDWRWVRARRRPRRARSRSAPTPMSPPAWPTSGGVSGSPARAGPPQRMCSTRGRGRGSERAPPIGNGRRAVVQRSGGASGQSAIFSSSAPQPLRSSAALLATSGTDL